MRYYKKIEQNRTKLWSVLSNYGVYYHAKKNGMGKGKKMKK